LLKQDLEEELALIKMDRFSRMKKIDIKDYVNDSDGNDEAQTRTIVRNILQYSCAMDHVRELSLEDSNLVNIGPGLLAGCVLKLHTLNLRYCQLGKDDLLDLVSNIHRANNLKSINLSCMDLSCLPPHMLQAAAEVLEELSLNNSSLSVEQCKSIIIGVRNNPLLTSLGLGGQENLKHLPTEMMLDMVTPKMKCLELNGTNLTPNQMEVIFQQICKLPVMTKLDLTRNMLTEVDNNILAEALSNVEELGLMQTELGKEQVDSLLGQILKKQNTKEVNLYEVNLSDVDKSLLSEAVTTIQVVVLSCTSITCDQITSLLMAIRRGSRLRTLYLNQDQLNKVDPQLLCEAVTSLEYVYLLNTGLERKVVTQLVLQGLRSKRLKYLLGNGIRLSNITPETFHILSANLDKEQIEQLLPEYARAGVREIKLNNTNFTQVNIGILTQNIQNLTFLDLSFSKLKKDQLTFLLNSIKNCKNLQELDLTGIDFGGMDLQLVKDSIFNVKKVLLEKNYLCKLSEVVLLKQCLQSSKMKYLSLHNVKMTYSNGEYCIHCEHLNSIEATMVFEMVRDNPKVKELIMTGDDLSKVDANLLSCSVSTLRSVSLLGTHLTVDQLSRILAAASCQELKSLNLSSNNLSGLPSHLLVAAMASLEVLGLESTSLTQEQCRAVLGGATESSALRYINLTGVDWTSAELGSLLKEARKKKELYIKSSDYLTDL